MSGELPLAARTARMALSPTMKVAATVDRMRRAGIEVLDFGAGEPDFPTPDGPKQAAHAAIDANFTKYTPNAGTSELKRAICDRYRADYGIEYDEPEVIVTAGGKQALYNAALALFGPGDEVITHAPGWPTLVEQIKLAEATPVVVRLPADEGFEMTARRLLEPLTARTRGIIVNSPCNPTGAVMRDSEMEVIADVASRRGIWVVLDLCYEKLIYDPPPRDSVENGRHGLPAVVARRCRDRAVICGSTSKAYAMTGWRCGWTLGPSRVIAASAALQSHATSNVSSITQKAAVAALTGSQEPVRAMLDEYRRRRDSLHEWLTAEPRLRCGTPAGAFYMFVDVTGALGAAGLPTSAAFADALLEDARVAVTPGEAFDAPGFIRISFATSLEILREGSRRLIEFVRARVATGAARP